MDIIYKILSPFEWEEFQNKTIFYGSELDLKDGFIHCSFENQYLGVIKRYFSDQCPLILLLIHTECLSPGSVKVEANSPGGEKYPHIYGPVPLKAVLSSKVLHEIV
jgi:uncharacterized protein (DUF952 family)